MYRLIWFDFAFIFFVQIAISTIEMENISTTNRRHLTKQYRVKRFRLGPDRKRILSLHSEVAQFAATYIRRDKTFEATTMEYDQSPKGSLHLSCNLTQSTSRKAGCSAKKTYPSRKLRRQILHLRLMDIFSEFDNDKKAFFISTNSPSSKATTCYMEAFGCFMSHCSYDYFRHARMREVKDLLARACSAKWLDTKKIVRIMENCCSKRFKFALR